MGKKLCLWALLFFTTIFSIVFVLYQYQGLFIRNLLVSPIEEEIGVPKSFWKSVDFEFFSQPASPYIFDDNQLGLIDASVRNAYGSRETITINLRSLEWCVKNSGCKILQHVKEILAHEVGHVLYHQATGERARQLKHEIFPRVLGPKFKRPFIELGSLIINMPSEWGTSDTEAFADLSRMILCPTCIQKPDTAVVVTDELKTLVKEIIYIALQKQHL